MERKGKERQGMVGKGKARKGVVLSMAFHAFIFLALNWHV